MREIVHHVVSEGIGRGTMWLMDTLYAYFGEAIILIALLSLLIVPCTWKVLTAKCQNDRKIEIVEALGNGLLVFAAVGIASRAASWLISLEKVFFEWVVIGSIGAFVGSCAIWGFSAKIGDELSCLRMGRVGEWFRKPAKEPASLSPITSAKTSKPPSPSSPKARPI